MAVNFNVQNTCNDMVGVIKQQAGDGWSKMKSIEQQFKASNEERLKMIAELCITGELDQQEFLSRLNDEKLQLEAQLNALSVLSKATVQNAVNAAIDIFQKAVLAAIP